MIRSRLSATLFLLVVLFGTGMAQTKELYMSGSVQNDLYPILLSNGFKVNRFTDPASAIQQAKDGAGVLILAEGYPNKRNQFDEKLLAIAKRKKLKVYLEYPEQIRGVISNAPIKHIQLERGVIATDAFKTLKPLDIIGLNDAYIIPVQVNNAMIVAAKVAGFNKAEYGIEDTEKWPVLFNHDDMLVATTKLSNFATARNGPEQAWKSIWSYLIWWTTGVENLNLSSWPSHVTPMYSRDQKLPAQAKAISVQKGVDWFAKGRFYIHPTWKDHWLKLQGDGTAPVGPAVNPKWPVGDGSLGLLEGHSSSIYYDGTQAYRYWIRADVQGEGAFALASAGSYLHKKNYSTIAERLIDYVFKNSDLRAGPRNSPQSPSYGLVGWATTHPHVYYGDDNARMILGMLGASAYMGTSKWDKPLAEAIMANFRTTGVNGFRGSRQDEKGLQANGWKYYNESKTINPAPHFESWMWACYLWLYQRTGYEPLLTKTKEAISITMKGYPDEWRWTNGIQQERARMVLPLAWLVRVEDTPEHRKWLDIVVSKLLENQVESGAIREELGGAGKGKYGRTKSNADYGKHEAPLIFNNGDPVADMLYTSNFAFFSLNEAAHATGNKEYQKAVDKLGDFLTRIQVKSDQHKDVDGAWFRSFEYDKWEYWASNADAGWGAWGTLTGWTQSWIVATQVLTAQKNSFWDLTEKSAIKKEIDPVLQTMQLPPR